MRDVACQLHDAAALEAGLAYARIAATVRTEEASRVDGLVAAHEFLRFDGVLARVEGVQLHRGHELLLVRYQTKKDLQGMNLLA